MTRAEAGRAADEHIRWLLINNPAAILTQLRELIIRWLLTRGRFR